MGRLGLKRGVVAALGAGACVWTRCGVVDAERRHRQRHLPASRAVGAQDVEGEAVLRQAQALLA